MKDLMKKGTPMNMFKTLTLRWWQTGFFKLERIEPVAELLMTVKSKLADCR